MPRSGRLRNYIREFVESPRYEKFSVIPPFLVLTVEIILLQHALSINAVYVIALTTLLLILSLIEIFFVAREIHESYLQSNFDRILTIQLDDFIIEKNMKNVKKLVEYFIEKYPRYNGNKSEVYHIACQIMQTHKEEEWEKILNDKLKKFIKRRKKMNIDDILKAFIKKHPQYKKHPGKIYHEASQIMGISDFKKENH